MYRYLFVAIGCFILSGVLFYQSVTVVPFVSDLQVVSGTLETIDEREGAGSGLPDGLSLRLHQSPVAFQYWSAAPQDYALLQQQLTEGDQLTLWTAPRLLSGGQAIWHVQKDDKVILSYDYIKKVQREQFAFSLGGLCFMGSGIIFVLLARRRQLARSRNPYVV